MRAPMAAFRWLVAALAAFLLLLVTATADAHGMRTAFVEIEELSPGNAAIHLRTSLPESGVSVQVEGCALAADFRGERDQTGTLSCAGGTLAGHAVTVTGLGPILTEAAVWVRFADGNTASEIATRDAPRWSLPAPDASSGSAVRVAREYVGLGIEHILTGYDHLLFLLLLVLALRDPKRVLLAETAFTLSHSISFTATALGWLRVSPVAAEACIALTLVVVALDVRDPRTAGPATSTWAAAGLAFVFGLVHGLGFAGGLREIGLPEHDVASALIGFGAGVEVGQVAFLAGALTLVHFAKRSRHWPPMALGGAYAGGAVASFWLLTRVLVCFSG